MFNFNHFSRWQAAGTHLLISTVIAVIACIFILFVWYPGPLFSAIGGQVLLALIVGIDVCLGPLMTLILFNPKKARHLIAMDLSIIAVVQVCALVYGVHTAFVARPAFIVHHQDSFTALTANDIEQEWLDAAKDPAYRELPFWGPKWVSIRDPETKQENSDYSFHNALRHVSGMGVQTQAQFYVPMSERREQIKAQLLDPAVLAAESAEYERTLNQALTELDRTMSQVGYLPLRTRKQTLTVLLDRESGQVLKTLSLNADEVVPKKLSADKQNS